MQSTRRKHAICTRLTANGPVYIPSDFICLGIPVCVWVGACALLISSHCAKRLINKRAPVVAGNKTRRLSNPGLLKGSANEILVKRETLLGSKHAKEHDLCTLLATNGPAFLPSGPVGFKRPTSVPPSLVMRWTLVIWVEKFDSSTPTSFPPCSFSSGLMLEWVRLVLK